jgi:hypothetical protein
MDAENIYQMFARVGGAGFFVRRNSWHPHAAARIVSVGGLETRILPVSPPYHQPPGAKKLKRSPGTSARWNVGIQGSRLCSQARAATVMKRALGEGTLVRRRGVLKLLKSERPALMLGALAQGFSDGRRRALWLHAFAVVPGPAQSAA